MSIKWTELGQPKCHRVVEDLPLRLGGLFPLRELRPRRRSDQTLRVDAARVVHCETPPAWARLGLRQIYCSGDDLGLISLNGIVVAPRPHRAWRANPNTAGKGRR
jgi:hypothetical protein